MRSGLWGAALLALCTSAACAGGSLAAAPVRQAPAARSADVPQALTDLNAGFRRAYADAKRRTLAGADPVIIAGGDTVVLIRGGRRVEARVNVPVYDALKTIAHVPLAIDVALSPGEGPLDADRIKTLEGLRALILPARASVAAMDLPAPIAARQDRIVTESTAFLDETLARREIDADRRRAFVRRIAPFVEANIGDAARSELDSLHAQVTMWRREMDDAAWARLHVVVVGSHMPRDGSIVMQYFSRLLHEPAEGRRIVYAEALWEEPRQLDLLGTHLLDGGIGEDFFGEFMRMHRDLLGDASREYLLKLLPE